jgi:heptosyltransferase-1
LPTQSQQLRVLIVRLGAMGDILHSLPAATALRAAHPDWFIGWAVEPQWRDLLAADGAETRGAAMPIVDRLHIVAAKQWGRRPLSRNTLEDIRRVRRELSAEHYDVCVDLQGAVRSAVLGKWAHPQRLIGEAKPREWAAQYLFDERVETHGVHVIEQSVEVANAVAPEQLPLMQPCLPVSECAERNWDAYLAAFKGRPFVILNPGAGWGAKRWPTERYGEVAGVLAAKGYGVVINAGPGEETLAREVNAASGDVAIVLTPSLDELISLTRRTSLVIAGDTGPLHLASALGKPVVGIYGPTDPARNGPFGSPFRVLRHPESRRDHTRHAEPEAGLLTITPEDVLNAADELLKDATQDAR